MIYCTLLLIKATKAKVQASSNFLDVLAKIIFAIVLFGKLLMDPDDKIQRFITALLRFCLVRFFVVKCLIFFHFYRSTQWLLARASREFRAFAQSCKQQNAVMCETPCIKYMHSTYDDLKALPKSASGCCSGATQNGVVVCKTSNSATDREQEASRASLGAGATAPPSSFCIAKIVCRIMQDGKESSEQSFASPLQNLT